MSDGLEDMPAPMATAARLAATNTAIARAPGEEERAGPGTGPSASRAFIVLLGRCRCRSGGFRSRRGRDALVAATCGLRIGDRLLLVGLRLLLARGLVGTLQVVALLLVEVVLRLGLLHRGVVGGLGRALVLHLEVGLGSLLVVLRLGLALVLLVALHRVALGLRRL